MHNSKLHFNTSSTIAGLNCITTMAYAVCSWHWEKAGPMDCCFDCRIHVCGPVWEEYHHVWWSFLVIYFPWRLRALVQSLRRSLKVLHMVLICWQWEFRNNVHFYQGSDLKHVTNWGFIWVGASGRKQNVTRHYEEETAPLLDLVIIVLAVMIVHSSMKTSCRCEKP